MFPSVVQASAPQAARVASGGFMDQVGAAAKRAGEAIARVAKQAWAYVLAFFQMVKAAYIKNPQMFWIAGGALAVGAAIMAIFCKCCKKSDEVSDKDVAAKKAAEEQAAAKAAADKQAAEKAAADKIAAEQAAAKAAADKIAAEQAAAKAAADKIAAEQAAASQVQLPVQPVQPQQYWRQPSWGIPSYAQYSYQPSTFTQPAASAQQQQPFVLPPNSRVQVVQQPDGTRVATIVAAKS